MILASSLKVGKIERSKDAPVDLGVRADRVTVDPISGRYLILTSRDDAGPKGFEFDSDANVYRPVETFGSQWPFSRYAMPVVAFIPEYGVTMWAEQKVYLYKHDAPPSKAK